MATYHPVEGIRFDIGHDKDSAETRISRGVQIGSQAPQSPFYQEPEVKLSVDAVAADTAALKNGVDGYNAAVAATRKARATLVMLISNWDGSYDLLLAAGEKHCANADDGTGLGLAIRPRTSHVFTMPLGVTVKYDPKRDVLRIHVKRAAGTCSITVEVSTDPSSEASWKQLPGDGTVREIKSPAPGMYWIRAASRSARETSDFTTPVSVLVK